MSSEKPPPSGNPLVLTFLDGSLRARTGELAVHIALQRPGVRPGAVLVTLERQSRRCPPSQWEFPIRLHGLTVMVGEAEATEGEAPLLRAPGGEPTCPVEIDDLFTRAFRLFCVINKERLALLALGMTPLHIWMVRA